MNPYNDDSDYQGEERTDQDALLDMVHEKRGLPTGAEPPRRPTRITHHEIKAMKVTVQKESAPHVTLLRKIGGLFSGILGIFGFLIPTARKSKTKGCELNGHVFPKNWKGDFPHCTHCGVKITHPDKIRPNK